MVNVGRGNIVLGIDLESAFFISMVNIMEDLMIDLVMSDAPSLFMI